MKFSKKSQIAPSATVAISALALAKQAEGIRVYNFAKGDPVLDVHPATRPQAEEQERAPYGSVAGIPELRAAAAQWMNATHGTTYTSAQILVTCGGKYALFAALQALVDEGDEVIFPAPYWVSYPEMPKLFGGVAKPIVAGSDQGWKMNADALRAALTPKSKILIFNNPVNPTGVVYTRQEIAAILKVAKEANLVVIADEVYSNLVYEGEFVSCGSFLEHADHLLIVQSCSKNFGLAGWRVGFAFGPEPLIRQMTALQGQCTTGTSIISQRRALATLQQAGEVNAYVKKEMRARRDLFMEHYRRLFNPHARAPAAAIYFFAPLSDMTKETDCVRFCESTLQLAHVALVPGVAFGVSGYVRFAFSELPEEIVGGLEALARK